MTERVSYADRVRQRLEAKRAANRVHICGNCRTPTGPSALPCKNDPNRRPA